MRPTLLTIRDVNRKIYLILEFSIHKRESETCVSIVTFAQSSRPRNVLALEP